jgi:hypothetical protein
MGIELRTCKSIYVILVTYVYARVLIKNGQLGLYSQVSVLQTIHFKCIIGPQ